MIDKLRAAAQAALGELESCVSDEYGHRCNRCDSEIDAGGRIAGALRAALAESNDTDDVAKKLAVAEQSRDWYKRRTEALQQSQTRMRDPERTMVCDILANGRLLEPPGNRYATLTEPEVNHEPFLWYEDDTGETWTPGAVKDGGAPDGLRPLYTAPIKQDVPATSCGNMEPVAWMDCEGDVYPMPERPNWAPPHTLLYATPPRREWAGLTAEETQCLGDKLFGFYPGPDGPIVQLVRAVEAALKERNT